MSFLTVRLSKALHFYANILSNVSDLLKDLSYFCINTKHNVTKYNIIIINFYTIWR